MEFDLREYIRPLLRWWWLIVLASAVAAGSSYLATRQQPDIYRSTTSLIVGSGIQDPNPSNNDLFITSQLASNYVDLAYRESVQRAAYQSIGLDFPPGDIYARQFNDSNVVDISVWDTDPRRAQAYTAALAEQLVKLSPNAENEDEVVAQLLAEYESQIEQLQTEVKEKQLEIGGLVSASEIKQAREDLQALESNLREITNIYANLRSSSQQGATNTVRIIEPANLPQSPEPNNSLSTILTAASIGFVLAASAAYVLEYLDDTIKSPDTLTKLTQLPVLAGIADMRSDGKELIALNKPRSPVSEAFRILRTGIQFSSVDNLNRILLVTSATPREGKSTTVANLAAVMAQAGHRVLLIDSDLRRPAQHTIFDVPNRRGLTSLLLEFDTAKDDEEAQILVNEMVQATQVEGLQILTSGPVPPNPSELLGSMKMHRLMEILSRQFDFLLLDSPPVLSVTDAAVLSTQVGRVLLVVRAEQGRRPLVKQAVGILREVNANLLGCVLNAIPLNSQSYSFYYYYQDDYYSDVEDQEEIAEEPLGKLRKRFLRGESQPQDDVFTGKLLKR